jgi:hypothetical protein
MPDIAWKKAKTPHDASGIWVISWGPLKNGEQGAVFTCPHFADKSIQVIGTFGDAGAVVIEGSNDPDLSEFVTLNDAQGNPLSVTLAKLETILENVYAIRPRVSAGDGTTSLTVFLVAHTSR